MTLLFWDFYKAERPAFLDLKEAFSLAYYYYVTNLWLYVAQLVYTVVQIRTLTAQNLQSYQRTEGLILLAQMVIGAVGLFIAYSDEMEEFRAKSIHHQRVAHFLRIMVWFKAYLLIACCLFCCCFCAVVC